MAFAENVDLPGSSQPAGNPAHLAQQRLPIGPERAGDLAWADGFGRAALSGQGAGAMSFQ